MKDLLYIIKNTKEGNCTECVKQSDFEVFLEESYKTTISENKVNCVKQTDFEKFLKEYCPECRPNGMVKHGDTIERIYHISKDQREIARIKVIYKQRETEVLIEGRKSEEVLAMLKTKNGFNWEEKRGHYVQH